MDEETVSYRREDIVRARKYLEILRLSLARIGSAENDVSPKEALQMQVDFLRDWSAYWMLAHASQVLSAPFSDELGEDEMSELEREFEGVPFWRWSQRQPPPDFAREINELRPRDDDDDE